MPTANAGLAAVFFNRLLKYYRMAAVPNANRIDASKKKMAAGKIFVIDEKNAMSGPRTNRLAVE
jgi:hypothetical protein